MTAQTQAAKPRWKTVDDFRAMKDAQLVDHLESYKGLLDQGVLPNRDNRPLTQAEQIRLRFYIAVIVGEQERRSKNNAKD